MKKISKKNWLIILVVVIVLIVSIALIFMKFNKDKNNENNTFNDERIQLEAGEISGRNFTKYLSVEFILEQVQGKYRYKVIFKPLEDNIKIEKLSAKVTLKWNGKYTEDKKVKSKKIKVQSAELNKNEDGTYSFEGEYGEENIEFQTISIKKNNFGRYGTISELSGLVTVEEENTYN